MSRAAWYWLALAGALLAGAALRLNDLSARPMHGDEAIHAYKANELLTGRGYHYDPHDYHGPTLNFLTIPVLWFAGFDNYIAARPWHFRLVTALAGIAIIALLPLLADGLGRTATAWAAWFVALSPALVYYSRDYIQETLLACFTLALFVGRWRYLKNHAVPWAIVTGGSLGLMSATKETWVINGAASVVAGFVIALTTRRARATARRVSGKRTLFAWGLAITTGVVVSATLYSSFFADVGGFWKAFIAYAEYILRARGDNSPHVHPWTFYFHRLLWFHTGSGPVWTEAALFALALFGGIHAFIRAGAGRMIILPRFFAIYTLVVMAAYTALPYKTPWCLIQFWTPLAILAGHGVHALLDTRWLRRDFTARTVTLAATTIAAAHLGWQSWQLNHRYAASYRNPYVYAQPLRDVQKLAAWTEKLAAAAGGPDQLVIQVVADDPWPLPWYLRALPHVGYYETPPDQLVGDIVITTLPARATTSAPGWMPPDYQLSYYGLRPDIVFLVGVRPRLYDAFVRQQTAPASQP